MAHFRKGMLIAAALLFGASLYIPCPVMAQEAGKEDECFYKTVDGKVVSLDWVGDVLIVDTGVDQLSFVVSRQTVFKKGTRGIIFAEVNQSDNVSVKYFDCGFAGLKAVVVHVTNGY